MSAGPMGPNPYAAPQFGGGQGGYSPELQSKADNAFIMGIVSIIVGLCCCPIIGLILGVLSMNNAGSVISLAPPGSPPHAKASTAKILAIVGMVLSGLTMLANLGIGGLQIAMMLNQ